MADEVEPRRVSPFEAALARARVYAAVGWEPRHVRELRPAWDEPRARAFLERAQARLAAATLAAGWAALEMLIEESEGSEECEECEEDRP